jgi:Uma2 family endonuclease
MSDVSIHLPSKDGEPIWEAAYPLPAQGEWTEGDFFKFHTNRMAELVNGSLEILPMPTWLHQLIVDFLVTSIKAHLINSRLGGVVLFAPLPTKLFPGTIREPDVLFVSPQNIPTDPKGYPKKLDFVMEVVSEGAEAHQRDYEAKRSDYAKAGIAEYWIVDPEQRLITVLGLQGTTYRTLGEYGAGQVAKGHYWEGFSIAVDQVLSVGASV